VVVVTWSLETWTGEEKYCQKSESSLHGVMLPGLILFESDVEKRFT